MEHTEAIIESNNLRSTIEYVTGAVTKLRAEMRIGNEWSAAVVDAMTYSELLNAARQLREQLDNAAAVREIIDKIVSTIQAHNLRVVCTSETPYPILKATSHESTHDASQEAWKDFCTRISSTRLVLRWSIAPRIAKLSRL